MLSGGPLDRSYSVDGAASSQGPLRERVALRASNGYQGLRSKPDAAELVELLAAWIAPRKARACGIHGTRSKTPSESA